jgi:hypothetical protein
MARIFVSAMMHDAHPPWLPLNSRISAAIARMVAFNPAVISLVLFRWLVAERMLDDLRR